MLSLENLKSLIGRRVLITGAAGHLGKLIAETVAELGASIILLDRAGAGLQEVADTLREHWHADCMAVECDLEIESQRESAIKKIKSDGKGLNCLVNNAAFVGTSDLEGWGTNFENQTLSAWRRAIEVNLTAPFHLSQAFAPELSAAQGGNIINITSIYGKFGPDWSLYEGTQMGNPAAYGASKAGLAQLTRWMATTLAPNVRVNAISPGGIFRGQPKSFVEKYEARVPMQRMAEETDFKGVIAFLASDLSNYVTGQTINVDGGWGVW